MPRSPGATMHDVARRAGVSIKTVSNVVNDYPYIRAETRARVEQAIAELGYQVNPAARNLRQGRTGMIALALPELSQPYLAELADHVMLAAERAGVTLLIERTSLSSERNAQEREREIDVIAGPRRRLTDGLLYYPVNLDGDDLRRLAPRYPLVLLGESIFDIDADHVTMANTEAARAATEHLIARGRRRIAVVGGRPAEHLGSATLRIEGYRQALAAAGIPEDPRLVLDAVPWHRATGAEAITAALAAGIELDGVFALNDALAFGVLHGLHDAGLQVPGDVAVIGFDDVDDASYSFPTLSTVDPGIEWIAQAAVDVLVERIAKGEAAGPYRRLVSGFQVVGRESTARSPR